MKTILYSILLSVIFFSCKKQTDFPAPASSKSEASSVGKGYLARVRSYMQMQMPDSLFKSLDSSSVVLTQESSYYFRIGFVSKPMYQKFVLLTTDSTGNVSDGKIIELFRIRNSDLVFNGELRVRTISGKKLVESTVTNGFVDTWKGKRSNVSVNSVGVNMYAEEEPVYQELPEVTVYPDGGGGISDGDIYLLLSGLNGYGSGYSSGAGYPTAGGSAIYTRAASPAASPVARAMTNRPVIVKVETSYKNPAINVKSFLNCFGSVPDAGATYAINVYVDLPVDNDPTQFFDLYSGATGHVFLGLTKSSGGQSVTQYMGFTAASALSAITSPHPVAGKVVDNSGHKYSAKLSTSVSAAEFSAAMNQLNSQSSAQYDIVNYNCVDFALGVVNSARGNYPLVINKYPAPDETTPMSTPEALYNTINSMSRSGGPEAGNTSVGNVWSAGDSHGACN